MLSNVLKEKLNEWSRELDEIREKIEGMNVRKRESAAAVQAALKGKNPDDVIAARQTEAKADEALQALKLIEAEIAKAYPVDHDTFREEYGVFLRQQKDILDEKQAVITKGLLGLRDAYLDYESLYQVHIARLEEWRKLAEKIGLPKPEGLTNEILRHGKFRNYLSMLI